MKRFIILSVLLLAVVVGISAQSQNQITVGYNFLRQDVQFNQTPVLKFDENTDSSGISVGYTRFLSQKGNLGITGEIVANFDSKDSASLVTVLAGPTVQARRAAIISPYLRVLGGVARQNVTRKNIKDTTEASATFDIGAGLDFKVAKKVALRTGADYLNTGFGGVRQNAARVIVGIVF